jgi:prepilin-type N-terminal cleavage/methylation domain-containing protein
MSRRGVTLIEVLVGAAILAAVLLPLLSLFSTTTRLVGMEVAYVTAAWMADEALTQIVHVHRRLGRLAQVPTEAHTGGRSRDGELDLDTYMRRFENEFGVVLLPGQYEDTRGSRVHLSPARRGFRRYLTVQRVSSGPVRANRGLDLLWRARVRVEYDLVVSGKDLTREVAIESYFYQKAGVDGKFRPPE